MFGPVIVTCKSCKRKFEVGNHRCFYHVAYWTCVNCGKSQKQTTFERSVDCFCIIVVDVACEENPEVIHLSAESRLRMKMSRWRNQQEIDLGPMSSGDASEVTVDGITTMENGEILKDIPREILEQYENKKYKCYCKEQCKLVWSRKKQFCFYCCRAGSCKYFRRFKDLYDEYLPDDDIMLVYG
jgi:hypothetical protein